MASITLNDKEYLTECALRFQAHMISTRRHVNAMKTCISELAVLFEDEECAVDMDTADDARSLLQNQVIPYLNEVDNMINDIVEVESEDEIHLLTKQYKEALRDIEEHKQFIKSFKKWSAYEFSNYKLNNVVPMRTQDNLLDERIKHAKHENTT